MSPQIFFSVIIPTYDRRPFLKKAVDSVLSQTYDNLELIVVDDGSRDDTKDLINTYTDKRLKYSHQINLGVSSARNKGLELLKGDFIAFLDSDDRWVPDKLAQTLKYIQKCPNISVFHTDEIWYKNGKFLPQKDKHRKPTGNVYKKALPICCISISTAVIKRTVIDKVGVFDEEFEACEDYDFWLRVTSRYKVKLIPQDLTIKDGGRSDQLSSRIWGLDRFRIKALEKMLKSGFLDTEFYKHTVQEFSKKCEIFAKGSEKRGKKEESAHYLALAKKYKNVGEGLKPSPTYD